jgi:hypothetical protein
MATLGACCDLNRAGLAVFDRGLHASQDAANSEEVTVSAALWSQPPWGCFAQFVPNPLFTSSQSWMAKLDGVSDYELFGIGHHQFPRARNPAMAGFLPR